MGIARDRALTHLLSMVYELPAGLCRNGDSPRQGIDTHHEQALQTVRQSCRNGDSPRQGFDIRREEIAMAITGKTNGDGSVVIILK